MSEFRMPTLGADMEAGTLVEWLKHPGDTLARGDIIAIVDTAKGAIEIEVFEDGLLEQVLVQPGAKVPVGTVLAHIGGSGGAARSAPAVAPVPSPAVTLAPTAAPARTPEPAPSATAHRVRVSPLARKLAADLAVDLVHVNGTGEGGAITRDDVERAAAAAKHEPPVTGPPIPGRTAAGDMRTAIAAAMSRSKREIPHYYLSTTIDMKPALEWIATENESHPVTDRLLPAALLLKAVALALHESPELNGFWTDNGFVKGRGIHIGCAISLRSGGLVAPALHDVDQVDVHTVMRSLTDLVARARAGSLRSSELSDPTITVTNLGDLGVDSTFGIIYPPQVALVGFGRIAERPWVVEGRSVVRPLLSATLSADHRATDGHRGGLFLTAIDRLLQHPEAL